MQTQEFTDSSGKEVVGKRKNPTFPSSFIGGPGEVPSLSLNKDPGTILALKKH